MWLSSKRKFVCISEEEANLFLSGIDWLLYRFGLHSFGLPKNIKKLKGCYSSREKNLYYAILEIDRMASSLGLPNDLRVAASMLFRKVMSKGLIKGRSIEELVSAMLYIVCSLFVVTRTLKEIAEVSRSPLKKIGRAYIFLLRKLDIKLAPADPSLFIPRFCSKLGLDGEVREKAIEIIKEAQEKELTEGRGPIGIAAAAIYIAAVLCGRHCSEEKISDVTGVTEIIILNRTNELKDELNIK